jgi:hypothetical protein
MAGHEGEIINTAFLKNASIGEQSRLEESSATFMKASVDNDSTTPPA